MSLAPCFPVSAQDTGNRVTGKLIDSVSREPLAQATILVFSESDSLSRHYAVSSARGYFDVNGLVAGNYFLKVSYQKLNLLTKRFSLSPTRTIVDFGILPVQILYDKLPEVIVKDQSPITTKGDTIVYKANAYKTQPDAIVEDLLRKLPGLQLDRSGNLKAQGEQVQKIYVDGKEFFGNDPKMATKNLTADMIEQVQVFDDRSEQSKFNGIDDGSRIKAINLKLRKANKSGMFGNAYAGYGSNSRYHAGLSTNYFKGVSQLSLIGGISNIAASGTTSSSNVSLANDIPGKVGSGLNNSSSLGVNYHNFYGDRLDINASYLMLNDNNTNLRKAYRQTFLNDSILLTDRASDYRINSSTHRVNVKVNYSLDTFNTLLITSMVSLQNLHSNYRDQFINAVKKVETSYKSAENETASRSQGDPVSAINTLVWRKRFRSPRRTFTAGITNIYNSSDMDIYSAIHSRVFFHNNTGYQQFDKNYHITNLDKTSTYSLTLSYTEPIGKKDVAEISYSIGNLAGRTVRNTYNFNELTNTYDKPDDSLTNNFLQGNWKNQLGFNYKGNSKNIHYQLGFGIQQMTLTSADEEKNLKLSHSYVNILPNAALNYRINAGQSIQFQYRGRTNQPDIRQLQNVTDITSFPYIRKGNPSLKPEFVHTASLNYNAFNRASYTSLFVFLTYNRIQNRISGSIQQNGTAQIQMPVNVNGAYNLNATVGVGIPFRSWEGASLNTSTQFDFFRNINMVNSVPNFTNDLAVTQELMFNYSSAVNLDLTIALGSTYNAVKYTLGQTQNASYFTHAITLNMAYSFNKGVTISTMLDYIAYSGDVNSLQRNYLLWNASVAKTFFKNQRGSVRLSVNDILDNNINVSRYRSENYIEDSQNVTLRRFAMLTFAYKLNKVGK